MRTLFTIIFYITVTVIQAQIPNMLDRMIEKYPSAYRRVWYYYDEKSGKEYYRTQFSSQRNAISKSDITEIVSSYISEWNKADFSKATGTQYRSPDSISITLKGKTVIAMDMGPTEISTDWGCEVISNKKWSQPAFSSIVKEFRIISKGHKSKTTKVSYTGFPKGVVFVFHRGKGRGLTSGERTTLYNVTLSDFKKIRQSILEFIGKPVPVTVFDRTWQTMIKSETTPDFYAVGYDPAKKTLNFLHATVEDEICIPYNWQTINHLP